MMRKDSFGTLAENGGRRFVDMDAAARVFDGLNSLPISLRLVMENMLRQEDGATVTATDIEAVARRTKGDDSECEIAFHPSRVLMQDYSGMPALIDLAALRDRMAEMGRPVQAVNPRVRTDVVVDHSIIAHLARSPEALAANQKREIGDNFERFAFLKWAQQAFDNLRVVPPGQGIVHQINLEHLADVVSSIGAWDGEWLVPDTVVGADSHTPMINGLGVLGWGVGGIEAEAVMMGEPVSMLVPPVIGVKLTGTAPDGVLATDIVLSLTEILRKRGVVGTFLEFFGPGVMALSVADRATIANMTPEFGATVSLFPCDENTMRYLELTGRPASQRGMVETYLKRNGFWFDPDFVPLAADIVEFDLSIVRRTVAGPSRPEQRRDLADVPGLIARRASKELTPADSAICDGDVVIAAITSCTNTSNPAAMLAAGLVARRARALGLAVPDHVKTSLAPGSRIVVDYLAQAGLLDDLTALGFHLVGFGCTTCVGNSGELSAPVASAIDAQDLDVASVLSGNRNFEARVHPKVKSNFLMSPPLVVAYALAGTVLTDLMCEPIGKGKDGQAVFLADIWPDTAAIERASLAASNPENFRSRYSDIFDGGPRWAALPIDEGERFGWSTDSTYFQRPPFFDLGPIAKPEAPLLKMAKPLMILGDNVTTDHISPVGSIMRDSPAAKYLEAMGVPVSEYNTYGARRGNHDVMVRGTFANPRLDNRMAGRKGGFTVFGTGSEDVPIHDAATRHAEHGEAMVVIAGKNYGSGSARDWAAKGTRLLGISAVIAESFERIHRSNLVRMGVLPLQFLEGMSAASLKLTGSHRISAEATLETLRPRMIISLTALKGHESGDHFDVMIRIDTADEMRYFLDGGILPSIAKACVLT